MNAFTAARVDGKIYIALDDGKPVVIRLDEAEQLCAMLGTVIRHVKRKEDCKCKEKRAGPDGGQ